MAGIVEDEVLKVNELPVDPQRGASVGEMAAFEEAVSNLRSGDALVRRASAVPASDMGLSRLWIGKLARS